MRRVGRYDWRNGVLGRTISGLRACTATRLSPNPKGGVDLYYRDVYHLFEYMEEEANCLRRTEIRLARTCASSVLSISVVSVRLKVNNDLIIK